MSFGKKYGVGCSAEGCSEPAEKILVPYDPAGYGRDYQIRGSEIYCMGCAYHAAAGRNVEVKTLDFKIIHDFGYADRRRMSEFLRDLTLPYLERKKSEGKKREGKVEQLLLF